MADGDTIAVLRAPASCRAEVLERIRLQADRLAKFGATALYLFGSAARDEMRQDSDVDVFLDYDHEADFDLIALARIRSALVTELGRNVDVTTRGGLHPRLRDGIERSAIRVI